MIKVYALLLLTATFCLSGCVTYRYRIIKPAAGTPPVRDHPISLHYDPLEYDFSRHSSQLEVRISNPTNDRMFLDGNRSYVIGPEGESHPLRSRMVGPHSFTRLFLPPIPMTYVVPDYYAWGGWGPWWGWGWYSPYWGPYYGGFYASPPLTSYTVRTSYDWVWKEGPAQLHLTYARSGKTFEHDFEIVREQVK